MAAFRTVLSFLVGLAMIGIAVYFVAAQVHDSMLDITWPEVTLVGLFAVPGIRLLFPRRAGSIIKELAEAFNAVRKK